MVEHANIIASVGQPKLIENAARSVGNDNNGLHTEPFLGRVSMLCFLYGPGEPGRYTATPMNAFESIVAGILEAQGFWVRTNFKVDLTKEQKAQIGRPTTPRWDLDVVAYQPGSNLLRIVECKSYLDSAGVSFRGFDPETGGTDRYKLFNDENLRNVIIGALVSQLDTYQLLRGRPTVELCLAAGNIRQSSVAKLESHFTKQGWGLYDADWILSGIQRVADSGYEDSTLSIMAKLIGQKNAV